ncbi:IQSEC1.2 family protein [Megaselia abdita]
MNKPIIVLVGNDKHRIRHVMQSTTRHVSVVTNSTRFKETKTHTSHHVTTIRFPTDQKNVAPPQKMKINENYGEDYYCYSTSDPYIPSYQSQLSDHISSGQHNSNQNSASYSPYQVSNYEGQYFISDHCCSTDINQMHKTGGNGRNGELGKRCRSQSTYELSQDLLDKQIELLERKYGGLKARNAAITIQRSFRHFMMVKKFASITAMAKTEKKTKKAARLTDSPISSTQEKTFDNNDTKLIIGSSRIPPSRSLSLRETRTFESSPIQQITGSPSMRITHPHINLLHSNDQKSPYYISNAVSPANIRMADQEQTIGQCENSSYNFHQNAYYTAAQIYMRPRMFSNSIGIFKKVPPEVPKRTSSIHSVQPQQQFHNKQSSKYCNGLGNSPQIGSLTSVQSSGSDSSLTSDRIINTFDLNSLCMERSESPKSQNWKSATSNTSLNYSMLNNHKSETHLRSSSAISSSSNISHMINNLDEKQQISLTGQHEHPDNVAYFQQPHNLKISETLRKRQYRVGLNLFNKKPEKGISYLMKKGFLDNTPQAVAKFLISRKGLSRQMIGEYLGNLQSEFNMAVLEFFAVELDLSGTAVDVALRKFQTYFRMPGEAQKIERLMEVFSSRYCQCNPDMIHRLRSSDTIFVMAFAIIMLNTDLHTPNLKQDRKMKVEDFIKNLRGIDDCHDIDKEILNGIYDRVKSNEFKPGNDHVTQVMKVQATIVGKKPNLALPHRRLVCYCRLYEITDTNKKERPGVHQREVFLFNDVLVVTKIFSKKKSSVTYTFRNSYSLCGMVVLLLDIPHYPFCIQLSQKVDSKVLVTFNARNEHDRCKFAEDLKEAVSEMDEMESLRIESELERQKVTRNRTTGGGCGDHRDSGVADVEATIPSYQSSASSNMSTLLEVNSLKRSALSNSLLDIHEQFGNDKPQRRGSVGSLDSGMSISFQTASNGDQANRRFNSISKTLQSRTTMAEERHSTEV